MPDPVSALVLSVEVALASTLLAAIPAVVVGYALARLEFPGKTLLSALTLVPLVLPPVVTGLVLLSVFGRSTTVGAALAALGLPLTFSRAACVLAALVTGFPLFVMLVRRTFETIDAAYEDVARSLGESPWGVFRRVTLPLAWPGIAAGAVVAFTRGLGEFGATAVVAGNIEGETRTLALAVYTLLDAPSGDGPLLVLVAVSLTVSIVALVAFETINRRWRRRLELHDG